MPIYKYWLKLWDSRAYIPIKRVLFLKPLQSCAAALLDGNLQHYSFAFYENGTKGYLLSNLREVKVCSILLYIGIIEGWSDTTNKRAQLFSRKFISVYTHHERIIGFLQQRQNCFLRNWKQANFVIKVSVTLNDEAEALAEQAFQIQFHIISSKPRLHYLYYLSSQVQSVVKINSYLR